MASAAGRGVATLAVVAAMVAMGRAWPWLGSSVSDAAAAVASDKPLTPRPWTMTGIALKAVAEAEGCILTVSNTTRGPITEWRELQEYTSQTLPEKGCKGLGAVMWKTPWIPKVIHRPGTDDPARAFLEVRARRPRAFQLCIWRPYNPPCLCRHDTLRDMHNYRYGPFIRADGEKIRLPWNGERVCLSSTERPAGHNFDLSFFLYAPSTLYLDPADPWLIIHYKFKNV